MDQSRRDRIWNELLTCMTFQAVRGKITNHREKPKQDKLGVATRMRILMLHQLRGFVFVCTQ
jgi:hypothetical protein